MGIRVGRVVQRRKETVKIREQAQSDIISIEKVVRVVEEEDDPSVTGELDAGVYALDSVGRVWRLVESATGLMMEFTEHDGVKRRRAKRVARGT